MGDRLIPGEVRTANGSRELCPGRERRRVTVENTGDRPVQVGSHVHFFEVNGALSFDRSLAFGFRLDVPAGTARRFEPGARDTVDLVAIGGKRRAHGVNGLVNGRADGDPTAALERAIDRGFAHDESDDAGSGSDAASNGQSGDDASGDGDTPGEDDA